MATLFGMFPFLKTLFADSGYQGPKFAKALAKVLPHLDIEIVKRSDQVSGFVVLSKRWIVERTIAWLNRCRRLAKDWENLNRKALALGACRDGANRSIQFCRDHFGAGVRFRHSSKEVILLWRPPVPGEFNHVYFPFAFNPSSTRRHALRTLLAFVLPSRVVLIS
jgi:transposase